ncbi:phosphonate ABC transporter, permease protein PhnE [Pseudoclavibacter endophyticus]|uniref:Phosphonate ABC transporter, permease protein PhnE n=1 Tax=Pseudoclavibacter endophyticus TaxID=1778590 RepID=A0A6H9WQV9_9MICO|nr:phosphonate ABC transporter, permease protein PhnE [Pseudoclavibacter endophyticus]KAB1648461.1 phosphonate ABC transporter, permease protein PhnE [Pseudoclavibacter endophyticus]
MRLTDTIHRRLPLHLATLALIAILLVSAVHATGADPVHLLRNGDQMLIVLTRLLSPDWGYLPSVLPALAQTVQMAIAGTALGVAAAVPVAFAATSVVSGTLLVTAPLRMVLNVVRTIPDMLLAGIFVAVVGTGAFTGTIALAVFTFGMVTKLLYEAIDTIDRRPLDALVATGAGRSALAVHGVLPQVRPSLVSYALYALEVNVRASAVLGYMGAGGIGVTLQSTMGLMRYDRVAVIILAIFVVVLVIDLISGAVRRRLL